MSDLSSQIFLSPPRTTTGRIQRLGIALLALMILLALAAPWLTPYGPSDLACVAFEKPSRLHPFGCDDAGHDLFSQLLHGARVSLLVGLLVATLSTTIAAGLAVLLGVYGGWIDRLLMRIVDVVLAMPFTPLVIVLGVYFGASIQTQICVIAAVMWASPLRELRAQVLALRNAGYVEASRAMGAGAWFIGFKHLLPELAPLIVPQFIRIAHAAILVETSLSFLGLGDPLQDSWGTILFHANARAAFLTGAWVYWILPAGLAIALTVLALAFIGYGYDGRAVAALPKTKARPIIPAADAAPAKNAALTAQGLRVAYDTLAGSIEAVRGVSLVLPKGALIGLVGESGSGKTTASLAILNLLRAPARTIEGSVFLEEADLLSLSAQELQALRGKKIALVPQSAMNALNPVLSIGTQLEEALMHLPRESRRAEAIRWLQNVGLCEKHLHAYAHELSGGMRQRAVIAIALCSAPDVVIADEPTTGLDVLVQEEIMALLLSLRQRLNLSVLFVTHNLPLIARHADRIAVMWQGKIVEEGSPEEIRQAPQHPHTRALFDSLLALDGPKRWPTGTAQGKPILELRKVSKHFGSASIFQRKTSHHALSDISLALHAGEKLGLVGGSGAGKSTIARLLMGMIEPTQGAVLYQGAAVSEVGRTTMARAVHLVFQDPYQSIRSGLSILDAVAEPLRIHGTTDAAEIDRRVRAVLEAVRLPHDAAFLARRPTQLSGGQRQRVAFARALITNPAVIIADEPTSMLDQSVRMDIMELMEDLRQTYGTAYLFITHDIALARHFCDRLIVLKQGQVVETGEADQVIHHSEHPYTRALIAAAD